MTAKARYELHDDATTIDADLDLGAFYALNDSDPEDVNGIGNLAVGESYPLGGGASELFFVIRVA